MRTETIEWVGPEREIPGYGIARRGETKELPSEIAGSFIRQGLAQKPAKRKTTTAVSSGGEE